MSREKKTQKGKHVGYRQTTDDERLLAVLLVESGVSMESVAVDFGVSLATGIKAWIRDWRDRRVYVFRDEPFALSSYEQAAGYDVKGGPNPDDLERSYRITIERGPQWSRARVAAVTRDLARDCFASAIASTKSMVAPGTATLAAIGRVYRCLDDDARALYAPVWDLCQLAIDEIETGRAKLVRAVELAADMQRPDARAA